jgi:hypothetical protein
VVPVARLLNRCRPALPGGRAQQFRHQLFAHERLADPVEPLGADAIGLVFYPGSPRHVDVARAAALAEAAGPFVAVVGLFVNADAEEVAHVAERVPLSLLQFHGDESAQDCARLSDMSGEIGQHVNTAITSMQFQDMTSQLIDRTLKRVTGLREFLGTLGEHGSSIAAETGNEEIVERLGKVSMALAIQSLELRSVLRKAVEQRHLESGDIELF